MFADYTGLHGCLPVRNYRNSITPFISLEMGPVND